MAIAEVPGDPTPQLLTRASILGAWQADATRRHIAHTTGQALGPRIPWPRLASHLGNAWPEGLTILHGQPGSGKTAFGLQAAAEADCPALYLTAEMDPLELLRRVVARLSTQYLGRFRTGEMSPETSLRHLTDALNKVPQLAIADATSAWASPDWIETSARNVRGSHPHLLIVIDSLHSWAEGVGGNTTEYEALNTCIASLRQLASSLSCSILAIAERNRDRMEEGGLSSGAGSRKIEYGPAAVLALACEKDATFDGRGEKPITVKILKNRNGDLARSELCFHGALQRFREP